jgi:hypothetical protein
VSDDVEDMRRRIVRKSCEEIDGVPECYGCAGMGPERCTCDTISKAEHDEAVLVAHVHYEQRGRKACRDCAFRRGSPEMDAGKTEEILRSGAAFYCHQGMPVDARGGDAELGNYTPDDATRYPVCPGWVALKLARMYRSEAKDVEAVEVEVVNR